MSQRAGKRTTRVADARRKAMDLRVAGASYQQIAETLGIGVASAWRHVNAALDENRKATAESSELVRQLELDRLDKMVIALWPNRSQARNVDSLLRIQERRARLLGLDREPGIGDASGAFTINVKVVGDDLEGSAPVAVVGPETTCT